MCSLARFVMLVLMPGAVWAWPPTFSTDDPKLINDALEKIVIGDEQTGYIRLKYLLEPLGMKVKYFTTDTITAKDAREDPNQWLRRGDVEYDLTATTPAGAVIKLCPSMEYSSFKIIKRGKRWLAGDRNGNFILNNNCWFPWNQKIRR